MSLNFEAKMPVWDFADPDSKGALLVPNQPSR